MVRPKIFLLIITALFSISAISNTESDPTYLLEDYDFELEEVTNNPTAPISIQDSNGQLVPSYNEWICLSSQDLVLTCSEHEFEEDETVIVPMISVDDGNKVFEFEVSSSETLDCNDTLEQWVKLVDSENAICVLAAYLQNLTFKDDEVIDNHSLWILDGLKTKKGYWFTPSLNERLSTQKF